MFHLVAGYQDGIMKVVLVVGGNLFITIFNQQKGNEF